MITPVIPYFLARTDPFLRYLFGTMGLSILALVGMYLFEQSIVNLPHQEQFFWILKIFFWIYVIDAAHMCITYRRTFLAPEFRERYGPFLFGTFLIFLAPMAWIVGAWEYGGKMYGRSASYMIFFIFLLNSLYHQGRQHWGILRLCDRREGVSLSLFQRRTEGTLLSLGVGLPFLDSYRRYTGSYTYSAYFPMDTSAFKSCSLGLAILGLGLTGVSFFRFAQAQTHITFWDSHRATGCILSLVGVGAYLGSDIRPAFKTMILVGWIALGIVGFIWIKDWIDTVYKKGSVSLMKKINIIFMILFTMGAYAFLKNPFLASFVLTLFHCFQYLHIGSLLGETDFSRKRWIFYGGCVGISMIYFMFLWHVRDEFLFYLGSAFFNGLAYHHTTLDSVIWKFRKHTCLSRHSTQE